MDKVQNMVITLSFDTAVRTTWQQQGFFLQVPGGRILTYAQLSGGGSVACATDAARLNAGDRVAVQIAKSPQALAVYAACVQAELVFFCPSMWPTRLTVIVFCRKQRLSMTFAVTSKINQLRIGMVRDWKPSWLW
jgi:hypothetical protein